MFDGRENRNGSPRIRCWKFIGPVLFFLFWKGKHYKSKPNVWNQMAGKNFVLLLNSCTTLIRHDKINCFFFCFFIFAPHNICSDFGFLLQGVILYRRSISQKCLLKNKVSQVLHMEYRLNIRLITSILSSRDAEWLFGCAFGHSTGFV